MRDNFSYEYKLIEPWPQRGNLTTIKNGYVGYDKKLQSVIELHFWSWREKLIGVFIY